MAEAARPVSILISALGGQGGGVLTEWIVAAAAHAGYPAQSTSIPGVAQRTGATTYYLEVFPEHIGPGAVEPTFSLYPMAGDVDVIIASEMLEAGRTLETDYASPDRTTVIASTHRLFAIGEKSALGNGVFPHERLEEAARVLARRLIAFDALQIARRTGSEVNAVLLGALAATRILPMSPADFEAAIREGGVAVDRNVAGFRAGIEAGDAVAVTEARSVARPWAEVAGTMNPRLRGHAQLGIGVHPLRVVWREHVRLDAERGQVLRELERALHAPAACGREVHRHEQHLHGREG
jgi:indolepyruvate ferredoxin oxidoreductase beta subunit